MDKNEKKLEKISKMLELVNQDYVSSDEVVTIFKTLIENIQSFKTKIENEVRDKTISIENKVNNLKLKKGDKGDRGDDGKTPKKGIDYFDGEDGKNASEIDIQKVTDQIENDLPKLGERIRDGLELLKGNNRLDYTAIKGLEELIKELISKIKPTSYIGGLSSGGGRIVKSYDLSGSLNGVSKTFTLPSFWRVISILPSSYPNSLRETIDWTSNASAMSITFTDEIEASTTLASGQTLIVIYSE